MANTDWYKNALIAKCKQAEKEEEQKKEQNKEYREILNVNRHLSIIDLM